MSVWEKYGWFWLRRSPYSTSGIVDIIFNSCTKIIMDKDTSSWAHTCLLGCAFLLMSGKRWPDEFGKVYGGRKQTDLTRDPYIAWASCYAYLTKEINDEGYLYPDFPWKLWTPAFWIWWRRMKRDNRKQYIKRLSYFMALATKNNFEKKYQDDFYE